MIQGANDSNEIMPARVQSSEESSPLGGKNKGSKKDKKEKKQKKEKPEKKSKKPTKEKKGKNKRDDNDDDDDEEPDADNNPLGGWRDSDDDDDDDETFGDLEGLDDLVGGRDKPGRGKPKGKPAASKKSQGKLKKPSKKKTDGTVEAW